MPKQPIKIAINGFGRIGRASFKIAIQNKNLQVVAINDLTDPKILAGLLKRDTVYGEFPGKVEVSRAGLMVNGKKYPVLSEKDPAKLPWKKNRVDVVLECTGFFTKDGAAYAHIDAGAKKVVISAPDKGESDIKTFLMGVNEKDYAEEPVVSMGSCTTNCVAVVAKVIEKNFGIQKALMTTTHAYTSTQNLVDGPNKDLRRARAAAHNIVPTTTGAAIATCKVIPSLKNRFDGLALRVPTISGSISDFTFLVKKKTTDKKVNNAFVRASKNPQLKKVLGFTKEPLVSSDIIGTTESAIVDSCFTKVVGGNLVKVLAWYDNEWAYSCRLVELAHVVAK